MNADEVRDREAKTRPSDGLQGLMDLARRSLPELRRDTETLEPLEQKGAMALLRRAREKLDWQRLPGLRPSAPKPEEKLQVVLAKRVAAFVLLPTALMAVYLFVFASDQYVAEAKFAVRGNVEPMGEASGGGEFAGLIGKHNSQDSFIVRDFVQSRAMAEMAQTELNVAGMFSRREADFWSRYRNGQPMEELAKYWLQHVNAHIEMVSGVITVTVRAFTPEDALAISKLVIERSERLVNDISRRAQADLVSHAEKDALASEERLKKSRVALQSFRNTWGIIDPVKSAESTLKTITELQKDKLKAENDLQVLRGSRLDENSRGIQTLVATVAAVDGQITRLRNQLTNEGLAAGAPNNITQALLEFEGLKVEQTIAEKLHESLQLMLDRARIAAAKQQVYLATFVPPRIPASSIYPERGHVLLITFFCCFALWSSASLLISGVKDQRL
ncbi:capsule biosynthesis protein [Methylobacterium brachythecii]|uniref:Capsular polysaccharide transport system permease protein n=1 Tax=Methylobacterium brachythecii TaxID=1176177 RepID=A0A7W6F706_9HYPH|nr:capsule biosynthesis protein [Methylobacterium brachythecii]MBB3902556.1 capsular polysaccharide transport system permease protein [Methylobacterium brachythecii]GLS42401.1 capsule polysaccharide transporter [Methylobacterium brachythecii]